MWTLLLSPPAPKSRTHAVEDTRALAGWSSFIILKI
jgi:hypothetical protein